MAYSSYWDPQSYSLIAPSDEIDQNHDGRRTSSFSLQSSSSIPESPFGMVTTEISPHTESLRASVGSIDLGISPISLPPAKQTLPPGFGDVAPQKSFRKQKRDGAEFHQAGASRLGIDTIQEEGHDADEANVGANIVDLNVESYNGRADMAVSTESTDKNRARQPLKINTNLGKRKEKDVISDSQEDEDMIDVVDNAGQSVPVMKEKRLEDYQVNDGQDGRHNKVVTPSVTTYLGGLLSKCHEFCIKLFIFTKRIAMATLVIVMLWSAYRLHRAWSQYSQNEPITTMVRYLLDCLLNLVMLVLIWISTLVTTPNNVDLINNTTGITSNKVSHWIPPSRQWPEVHEWLGQPVTLKQLIIDFDNVSFNNSRGVEAFKRLETTKNQLIKAISTQISFSINTADIIFNSLESIHDLIRGDLYQLPVLLSDSDSNSFTVKTNINNDNLNDHIPIYACQALLRLSNTILPNLSKNLSHLNLLLGQSLSAISNLSQSLHQSQIHLSDSFKIQQGLRATTKLLPPSLEDGAFRYFSKIFFRPVDWYFVKGVWETVETQDKNGRMIKMSSSDEYITQSQFLNFTSWIIDNKLDEWKNITRLEKNRWMKVRDEVLTFRGNLEGLAEVRIAIKEREEGLSLSTFVDNDTVNTERRNVNVDTPRCERNWVTDDVLTTVARFIEGFMVTIHHQQQQQHQSDEKELARLYQGEIIGEIVLHD